ncbi:hypothetical protein I3842_13G036400 [Carya illinoinensis]|uniref:HhH-GPD domain-containing protein n=1 Tax=Carya illinoinensis TaxID=32201 RepID=A0A922AGS7_CARIL|nr:hypothetical protein I3842_13G036400 [Carya illinoinensis]KAG6680329.1 hypothetical protein I3842_13G036400 [Carya illinoinensis]KAG6680330.1 hypothetical protein I3842_13G036400 [Carya illinoinensis]KAG6680333.1 hypothetical protein I3842_13G036400 [Carya illinoinensis]KAG6680334.1 hypothetical protein I3842_13G036400 [Carya illinoinensis]
MDSWMPVTPEKPIPTRSNPIPVNWDGNPMGRANWQEVIEFSNGYAEEMPNYNGLRRNSNLTGQVVQKEGYNGYDAGLAQKNRMINHIAGSHTQTLHSDNSGWKNDTFAQLLLMQNATLTTTANRDPNGSQNMAANSPLMPNSHLQSHVDCSQRDSTTSDGLLFNNQNHYAGFDPSSNLANRPLILEMHSRVDSNLRENPASLFFSNQNHYSGSNSSDYSDNYTQIPNYGFPIPYEPHWDLNSAAAEINAASSVTNTLQFAPITPDRVKKLENNQYSATPNIIRNESSSEARDNDTSLTSLGNKSTLDLSDELLQSIVNSSPAANNTLHKENKDSEKGSIPGLNLNETPQQKPPRRRKHRPKVIREGKPKRTPKPKTPKNTKEAQTTKRKYVRKNIQKESAPELADASREMVKANGKTAAKSCRRALNFDVEKIVDESQELAVGQQELPHWNKGAFSLSSDSRATELCPGTYSVSGTKSVVQIEQWTGLMEEQQQSGNINDLIHSTSQLQTNYVPLQQRQAAAASLAPEKDWSVEDPHVIGRNIDERYSDPFQNSCSNGWNPISQQIHAEGIDKVVFQANSNYDSMEKELSRNTTQSVPKFPSNSSAARGSKREHFHIIEGTNPNIQYPVISMLYQEIQTDECCKKGQVLGRGLSETYKKKKTVSGLHTNISGMPCVTEVEDGSGKAKTKQMNDNSVNGLTETTNHDISNFYFKSPKIAERQSEANKFTSERCNHSMTAGQNLLMQEISSDLRSHAEVTKETSRLTSVHGYPSLAAIEDCYMLQPSPPKQVPKSENQVLQTSHVPSTKHIMGPIPSRSVSARRNKVPKSDDALYAYQKSPAKPRGRPPKKRIYAIPIDEIIYRLKSLDLNERSTELARDKQNAVVLYKGYGALVPYPGFELIKKRKPRPKVDLDPETNRIWNLLMHTEGSKDFEGTDKEKEKWWEEERKVFRGRTDSFIARMHLIQGDRRFSRWKGSVVDSVIGVFLTQNVSDHLSSSAFMSLAARFPLHSMSNRTCYNSGTSTLSEESEVCINHQDDTIGWQEKVPSQPIFSYSSMTHLGSTEHQRDSETTGRERSIVDAHSQSMGEDVISSQDSFDSLNVQGPGGPRSSSGSNSEEEDFITGCRPSEIHFPTLTNLLQMEKTTFKEFYSQNTCSLADEGSRQAHKQSKNIEHTQKKKRLDRADDFNGPYAFTYPSCDYHLHINPEFRIAEVENFKAFSEESISPLPSIDVRFTKMKDENGNGFRTEGWAGSEGGRTVQQNELLCSQETQRMGPSIPLSNHSVHQESISKPGPHTVYDLSSCHNHQLEMNKFLRLESPSVAEPVKLAEALAKRQNNATQQIPSVPKVTENAGERISVENKQMQMHLENRFIKPNSNEQAYSFGHAYDKTSSKISKAKKGRTESDKTSAVDWDSLRKQVHASSRNIERSKDTQDSLDYEAIRLANVAEISKAIKERGMNNMLAERIKDFLNRLVREHGSMDLEWLRDVPPDKAKDYLLSIRGLGLKSVECVRLLTLHHLAFPVDTNVGRIAVRLGWVPLQPLPESLQLHLLELYPVLETIQKYLWPRLCNLDQRTLYELHYQLITFGKVFCTKSKPNCNACPMRGECRHFASAFASARLALPGPEEKTIVDSTVPIPDERNPAIIINTLSLLPPENNSLKGTEYESRKCEPIIEEPATPEQECTEISESDIEDTFYEDPDEIPTIKLNIEEFTVNLQNYMQEKMELEECDMSKALVALKPEVASIPTAKLKNVSRLRTEHQVYELPDSHPLLEGMDRREPDDPSPYLLAIWTPGETANSIQPPETRCGSQEPNKLCNEKTCFSCNSEREANEQTVRGTLLIPCRTAMRGSFPLNGTYFQVNEVFADHESSLNPIDVPRAWIWNLRRRTVYFGTSVTTIFKGLSTEGIQLCFWRGFVCVRGFDQKTRAPRPLMARLHFPASKLVKSKTKNQR